MTRFLIQGIVLFSFFLLFSNVSSPDLRAIGDFNPVKRETPAIFNADTVWVDSVLHSLSLDEKIAQLMMVAAYSNRDIQHRDEITELIEKYNIGGIIFFQGGPVRQALMTNYFQKRAKTPLMIGMDAEWGLAMRLDSTIAYPRQMMLGAIQDEAHIYQMGFDIGKQLRRLGVHINFAPVVDVNNNPENPVINSRSFGEDRMNVARKGLMYAQGLRDARVVATLKHFPGHGDTDSDSHYSLPVISHSFERLDSVELFPFKLGIRGGVSGIMSAHLHVPALDSTPNLASSLSPRIINDFLKGSLNFRGLVFTDALNMKGVSSYFKPGEVEVKAFLAGNDVLLMPSDVPKAIAEIKKEIRKGNISEEELDERCRKILFAKAWLGLMNYEPVKIDSLYEDLNDPFYQVEKRKFIRNALTLLKNQGKVFPLFNLESYKIASLAIGTGKSDLFSETLKLYTSVDTFLYKKDEVFSHFEEIKEKLKDYNTLIVSLQETSQWPGKYYGLSSSTLQFLDALDFKGNLLLTVFGNPYMFMHLVGLDKFNSILLAYDNEDLTKELAAQAIFGAFGVNGRIPVSPNPEIPINSGIQQEGIQRLSYGIPEEEGLSSGILNHIDSIAMAAIRMKATPGCQVLVSRHGNVVFYKAYGDQSYGGEQALKKDDLFDIASLTKITATLPSLMKLCDEGKFNTDKKLSDYLNLPDTCNKKGLVIKDILAHQAGLAAWIPFYLATIEPIDSSQSIFSTRFSYTYPYKIGNSVYANRNIKYTDSIYSDSYSPEYSVEVAKNLYIRSDYRDTIRNKILMSELGEKKYRYSDLGYYFFKEIIEGATDTLLYPFVYYNFYSKIGAETLGYLPLNRFDPKRIVPTENDIIFRRQLLRGYVHDPGAAMLGGIGGHAGLFADANDLAKMMQIYLNGGTYGGRRFLSDSVIAHFTARVFTDNGNRRALGFDKPETDTSKIGPTCRSASLEVSVIQDLPEPWHGWTRNMI